MHFFSPEREQSTSKSEAWQRIALDVDCIVDGLGKHVDTGIKESVVAVRALGLTTDGSCEGHLEGLLKAPYVDVGQLPGDFEQRWRDAWRLARVNGHETVDPSLEAEAKKALLRLRTEQAQLLALLDEFYRTRDVPLLKRLVVNFFGNTARLVSQGAELQDMYPEAVQKQKLQEFQDEMHSFTEFLKAKFFSM